MPCTIDSQSPLGLLAHECLIDALLDEGRHAGCVQQVLDSWLRGEDNMLCAFCPEKCWASRVLNLLQPDAIRRRLIQRSATRRLHIHCR
jgi:hypothetical protein